MEDKIVYRDLSYRIVGLAIQVRKELGFGFLEKVYENALMVLLRENGIRAEQQVPIKVSFHGQIIGDYIADILVEDSIILELKALDKIIPVHKAQVLNYLKATGLKLAILLNFGKDSLEHERLVM
ncbi:MAG: GxxExxY protein [Chloracidobacterium sp.]|nr:GxxExxY protein [Chloracidobacterium sp.]MCO5332863.1 GxxExxY protein [Pyrinomonadaceae bacterium]